MSEGQRPARGWLARIGVVGAVGVCIAAIASRLALISDDAMAPSYLPGDVVLLWPSSPAVGDVVAVLDPLDPSQWTLRRVEAIGGAIAYDAGSYVHDGEPALLDMGKDDLGYTVIQEGAHLTRHRPAPHTVAYSLDQRGVPDDSAWLGADNRDDALDSRWWGPVPLEVLQGTVVARFGPPRNRWRSWLALGG